MLAGNRTTPADERAASVMPPGSTFTAAGKPEEAESPSIPAHINAATAMYTLAVASMTLYSMLVAEGPPGWVASLRGASLLSLPQHA